MTSTAASTSIREYRSMWRMAAPSGGAVAREARPDLLGADAIGDRQPRGHRARGELHPHPRGVSGLPGSPDGRRNLRVCEEDRSWCALSSRRCRCWRSGGERARGVQASGGCDDPARDAPLHALPAHPAGYAARHSRRRTPSVSWMGSALSGSTRSSCPTCWRSSRRSLIWRPGSNRSRSTSRSISLRARI